MRVRRIPDLLKTAHTLAEATRPPSGPRASRQPAWDPADGPAPPRPGRASAASRQPFDPETWEQLRAAAAEVQQDKLRKQAEAQIAAQAEALRRQQARAMTAVPVPVKVPKPKRVVAPRQKGPARLQEYIDRVAAMSVEHLSALQRQEVEQDLDLAEDLVAEDEEGEREVNDDEDDDEPTGNDFRSFKFDPAKQRVPKVPRMNRALRTSLTAVDRQAREQERKHEFTLALQQLDILQAAVEAGDGGARDDWLSVATYLVDSFRETKQLFPSDGKKKFVGMVRSWKRKGGEENTLEGAADQMEERLLRRMGECPIVLPLRDLTCADLDFLLLQTSRIPRLRFPKRTSLGV